MTDASFAALLASAAASQNHETPWNDEELADDVATISYEQALRTHIRVDPPAVEPSCDHLAARSRASRSRASTTREPSRATGPASLKRASITIRLGETECAQLRRRAAESGMTVSAYLRSCTLEVESLRAQVKQTLAELRSSSGNTEVPSSKTNSTGWLPSIVASIRALFLKLGPRREHPLCLNAANPFAPLRR